MSKIPKHKPTDAAKTIPIYVGIMVCQASVLSSAKMEYAENHLVHGKGSTRSSRAKPLNSRLNRSNTHFIEQNCEGFQNKA